MAEIFTAIINSLKETFEKTKFKEISEIKEIDSEVLSPVEFLKEEINNNSYESLKIQNDKEIDKLKEAQAEQLAENRENGKTREEQVKNELEEQYPKEEGYKIHEEVPLRDENGIIVIDEVTSETRRVDFMVEKDSKIIRSVEVTSKTAPKEAQMSKEQRIREQGGNYIKDKETSNLIEIPENVKTEIRRLE
jgi:hypothetical protein